MARTLWGAALAAAALTQGVFASDVLETTTFTTCLDGSSITVQKINIEYNNSNKTVSFDVAGTSATEQKVMATLNVTAYGTQVYTNSFNPCDNATFMEQLCPIPAGSFSARGSQDVPAAYANMIPSIAFQVPDISAQATLELTAIDSTEDVACITAEVTNGKTTSVAAVSYIAAAVAGAALVLGGVTAAGSFLASGSASSSGGMGSVSPSFGEVVGHFQGMAMNGMMSVNLPPVYRSFAKNFGFAAGVIPWRNMQLSIDNFRSATGGDISKDGVAYLENATLVFGDGSTETLTSRSIKRALSDFQWNVARAIETSVNSTDSSSNTTTSDLEESVRITVTGIQAYVEELSVPSANTFMTVLLIVAIIVAAIAVGILLLKVILEAWALFGNFPEKLTGFRKHYWGSIARAITQLILLLYGVWVLYCIFQFTAGDSWAAKTLAGVTLALFTGVLGWFSYKIYTTAKQFKATEGDYTRLYEDKATWVKYSMFYESYKKDYWWVFVPTILYLFAKGCCLAAADGNGLAQTIAQLIVEGIMLCVLVWNKPFERKSSNVVNICIQVVRVLSVICILIFVDEFAIAETTQTVAGVVLIVIQSALTGLLAILIAWNAISSCIKKNPHRQRRKEMEHARDLDNLTPLDARNSLLLERKVTNDSDTFSMAKTKFSDTKVAPIDRKMSTDTYRPLNHAGYESRENVGLVGNAAPPSGYYQPAATSSPPQPDQYQRGPYGPNYGNGGDIGTGYHNGYHRQQDY